MSTHARAYERMNPLCPECGRVQDVPDFKDVTGVRLYFGELTEAQRTQEHDLKCYWCSTEFTGRFYKRQPEAEA